MTSAPRGVARPNASTDALPNARPTASTTGAPVPLDRRTQRRSMLASVTGQLLEWYEWSAYAVFAPFIAGAIFDPANEATALLSTFGVFAVGFLFRPLGGIVFGRIADKKGRRFVLVTTMLMMAGGSVLIGVLPGHDSIGVLAAIVLLFARIVQGFAHGGESATANSYIAEIAPAAKRGLWGSTVFMTIFAGAFIAFIVGGVITGSMPEADVQAWGWRIPFLLGALLAIVALWLRVGMVESQVFAVAEAEADDDAAGTSTEGDVPGAGSDAAASQAATGTAASTAHTPAKVVDGLGAEHFSEKNLRPLGRLLSLTLVFFLVSGVAASNYTWTSYISTHAITQESMDPNGAYWALVAALFVGILALPFWGAVSDRVGRRPVLIFFGIGIIVQTFPLMAMITEQPWTLFVSASIALIVLASGASLLACVMAETFPTHARTASIGLAYSMATAVFGGTMPYVNQFAQYIEAPWAANLFIIFAAALALWAAFRLPERKGIDLTIVR